MSLSRHHIPFPKNFLTVNVPLKKSSPVASTQSSSPATQPDLAAQGFLSNLASRPATVPRHSSVSSVSSTDSSASISPSSANADELAASPVTKQTSRSFLSLNTKYAAHPASVQAMKEAEEHDFLSNKV